MSMCVSKRGHRAKKDDCNVFPSVCQSRRQNGWNRSNTNRARTVDSRCRSSRSSWSPAKVEEVCPGTRPAPYVAPPTGRLAGRNACGAIAMITLRVGQPQGRVAPKDGFRAPPAPRGNPHRLTRRCRVSTGVRLLCELQQGAPMRCASSEWRIDQGSPASPSPADGAERPRRLAQGQ